MIQIADNPALRAAIVYIALLALGLIPLAFRVIGIRRGQRIGIGDGGNAKLAQAVRVHANYAENAPFGLALLLALPLAASPAWAVHVVGLCMVLGRAAHAVGLSQSVGSSLGRVAGMILTFSALLIGAATLLWRAFA
jgi:uncharacterized protein